MSISNKTMSRVNKPLLIIAFLALACTVKAQKTDTIVYCGCRIKGDTTMYVGSKPVQFSGSCVSAPDCTYYSYPKFPGGQRAWNKFLAKHLKWPSPTYDGQGKVFIAFVIEKNGALSKFTVLHAATPKFASEALKVIKLSPRWIPAKIHGKPVRSLFTVLVKFYLNG